MFWFRLFLLTWLRFLETSIF